MTNLPRRTDVDVVMTGEPSVLDHMDLPDVLERIDGTIRMRGHRISLYLVLDGLFDSKSLEELGSMYPTVSEQKLLEVIRFREAQPEATRAYHLEEETIARKLEEAYRTQPSIFEELKARRARILASRSEAES